MLVTHYCFSLVRHPQSLLTQCLQNSRVQGVSFKNLIGTARLRCQKSTTALANIIRLSVTIVIVQGSCTQTSKFFLRREHVTKGGGEGDKNFETILLLLHTGMKRFKNVKHSYLANGVAVREHKNSRRHSRHGVPKA